MELVCGHDRPIKKDNAEELVEGNGGAFQILAVANHDLQWRHRPIREPQLSYELMLGEVMGASSVNEEHHTMVSNEFH